MRILIIEYLLEILVCFFVLVGYASVDLVPCDKSRRIFTDSWGVITDGPVGSNYTQDSHCEWLIKANNAKKFITLNFRSMGTECSYDYVFVYDGDSFHSPLLGSFSGKTDPQQVIATSGHMLILLYSDTNYVLDGFRAEFSITNCPNNCSNHGVCYNHQCVCGSEWGGLDCSRHLCPDKCGQKYGRGRCEQEQGCVCYSGYSGQSCSLHVDDMSGNKWHWVSHSEGGLVPRAAHTAVYVNLTDSLYVFGGYNLNTILTSMAIYNFKNSTWNDEFGNILPEKKLYNDVDPSSVAALIEQAGSYWQHKWGMNSRTSIFKNLLYSVRQNVTAAPLSKRRQRHSHFMEGHKPTARYGHAACRIDKGFAMYGGKLENGSLSNELWYYNALIKKWELRARRSNLQPPPLTRHTLTEVESTLYLFGGSVENGEFSSKLFAITLENDGNEQWEEVKPRGGKELDVRVVAHTTNYQKSTNSLIVYGGILAGVARFSKLSDRMFVFQLDNKYWSEVHYTREHLREKFVPRERAFHTADILGNYLIIFGGYSHRHNKEEICYDNQIYLYHMGCHTWVNPEILGTNSNESKYPKHQGVFAHASSVRNGNTLLLVGGYHGNVNGDLLAYTVPPMIAARTGLNYNPEATCSRHRNYVSCSADPECGWCSADEICYGRTIGANCTTNLQTTRCPGVCPALGDCHSCLIHGVNYPNANLMVSASQKLHLGECTWCVQNARCHHKDDNYGICGLREDSPSMVPGWWGNKGTEVNKPEQCRELDQRPGLTFIKYHHPVNFSQPDHVGIINATTIDFNSPSNSLIRIEGSTGGHMVARLLGFLRLPDDWDELLNVCVSYCTATLKISTKQLTNLTAEQSMCRSLQWPVDMAEKRVSIDFETRKTVNFGAYNSHQQSKMELGHFKINGDTPKVFTFEYLEPFGNGTCSEYTNCLHCLTDSKCGWCDFTSTCLSRFEDESVTCNVNGSWRYLTLSPSSCSNCSNFISCESCTDSLTCEWWIEEAKCSRIGQRVDAAVSSKQCPTPCYQRQNCSTCLDQRGRCVWCEATQQCFSFSVYTSEYQFGMCREWLDQTFPMISSQYDNTMLMTGKGPEQCKSCGLLTNCSTCLGSLSCGWCYNSSNPMSGMCVQGDFNRPNTNCSEVLKQENAKWAYAQCPDVDECGLGLHNCHPQATCTNTDGSFSCQCKKGYIGDGRTSCTRTCYNVCVHGQCEGEPDYACRCDLGWFGDDCSQNCGCNNHSTCPDGAGICEKCQEWTMGEYCQYCKPGSFGNATTSQGCHPCECNGHGIGDLGVCDPITGICHCKDNTEGPNCERCAPNYYGDPRGGNKCYYQCESRGLLTGKDGQGISSMQAFKAPYGGTPTRECLWIIHPSIEDEATPIIQLQINSSQLNVTCGENAVYVYDGMPEPDTGSPSQSLLLGVFCTEEAIPTATVESRTGLITVHYKQGLPGEGFSALYKVFNCDNCPLPRVCKNNMCVCEDNHVGYYCEENLCPRNCSYSKGLGECDRSYGRCICKEGWVGPSCDIRKTGTQILFTELFNTKRLADHLEHLRKTLPRFGHSLTSDRRGSIWMFGGYSLSHGPLNDIRLFDTRNSTWTQVTVESTPDAKMPQGRYFHGADIIHSRQSIYVYGGLTKQGKAMTNRTLSDLWTFDIPNQRWGVIKRHNQEWPPDVAAHTFTSYRNSTLESLILIGGVSSEGGFLNAVWEFFVEKEVWKRWFTKGNAPKGIYGHTTVFHQQTNSLYVFGGYSYDKQEYGLSNRLYMLEYRTKTWRELNSLGSSSYLPRPRFLHSAITTESYMLVMGGKTQSWNITDTLYAYSYNCNQWFNLMSESLEKVGPLPVHTYAQAMATEPDGDEAYIIGGWGASSQCTVLSLELPDDICVLWTSKHNCLRIPGCAYCAIKDNDEIIQEVCHSNQHECPFGNIQSNNNNSSIVSNQGKLCRDIFTEDFGCNATLDCVTCVQDRSCRWCDGACSKNQTCIISTEAQCPFIRCSATDCVQCHKQPGCMWKNLQKDCVPLLHDHQNDDVKTCSQPCVNYTTCSECLDAPNCRWSTQLDECISASYQPMYCAGGVCGLVLQTEDKQYCPEPCSTFTQCSLCLKHAYCGWCAAPGLSGRGICTEGSGDKPTNGTCNAKFAEVLDDEFDMYNITYSWHYVKCPAENECLNGHHSCDPKSEICQDLDVGYECVCGNGYKAGVTGCEPVCSAGCVRGQCVQPNKCQCDFGYVGANCSIQCQCNGHANCEGPDKLDKCLKCHNNTMGEQCEKCEPLFVGDPSNSGLCIPCLQYCHGHTPICVDNTTEIDISEPLDLDYLKEILKEGPKSNAKCLKCANFTSGVQCDECIDGNFRGTEDHRDPCRPCDCHGHGDTCDPITGEKCNCKNNTESNVCGAGGGNGGGSLTKNSNSRPCWMVQCSKCKEGYFGTPTLGHQCYKQMSVEAKMCFDAKPIDECKMKPKPLHPGEMVFFVIQPRFMNVDIRIIIDVTQGRLNVFMSTNDDTYVAYPNATTGSNDIELDQNYGRWENGSAKTRDTFLDREALGLRTYITITQPKTILTVRDLKDRLVITLPEEYHTLETTRFFLVLQALDSPDNDKKVSYGIVFSRQDQLHIDLFVFFSVFFSCFFLFLAACVVAWKAKQAADVRRARRRHVVEMLHMAKRPFATVTLNLNNCRTKSRRSTYYDLRPVAIEPTEDGLAAVATVFVNLPGGQNSPVRLALASSLILLARQYPTGGRTFLRRRSSHAALPT